MKEPTPHDQVRRDKHTRLVPKGLFNHQITVSYTEAMSIHSFLKSNALARVAFQTPDRATIPKMSPTLHLGDAAASCILLTIYGLDGLGAPDICT